MAGIEAYAEAKKPVQAAIKEARTKLAARMASLQRGARDDTELEELRQSAELILAYQYEMAEGQSELCAQYDLDGPERRIRLNPIAILLRTRKITSGVMKRRRRRGPRSRRF